MAHQPHIKSWHDKVSELLARAAELAIEHDVDVDPFMRGAYTAYLEARPGLREQLEELALKAQLDELRKAGRIASA